MRYPVGSEQLLASLAEEYKFSSAHGRKIEELIRKGYTTHRRVRGDGNCFYRAAGFGFLESLATRRLSQACSSAQLSFEWPSEECFGELSEEYYALHQDIDVLCRCRDSETQQAVGQRLLTRLMGDVRFDLCVVVFVRLLVALFLQREKDCEGSDEHTKMMIETVKAQYDTIEQYVEKHVLPLGVEAEGQAIAIAAQQLGMFTRIVQLDGTSPNTPEYLWPSEDYHSPMGLSMVLLFRPGHYEILYNTNDPKIVCSGDIPGRCSYCRQHAKLPRDGLLVCFHRLCKGCSEQMRNIGAKEDCPVCGNIELPTSPAGRTLQWGAGHTQEGGSYLLEVQAPRKDAVPQQQPQTAAHANVARQQPQPLANADMPRHDQHTKASVDMPRQPLQTQANASMPRQRLTAVERMVPALDSHSQPSKLGTETMHSHPTRLAAETMYRTSGNARGPEADLTPAGGHGPQTNGQSVRNSDATAVPPQTTSAAYDRQRRSSLPSQRPINAAEMPQRATLSFGPGAFGGFNPQARSPTASMQERPKPDMGAGVPARPPQFAALPSDSTVALHDQSRLHGHPGQVLPPERGPAPPPTIQQDLQRDHPGHHGSHMAMTQQMLPQESRQGHHQCFRCAVAEDLKKVKCCQCHYCMTCIAKFISDTVQHPGSVLFCRKCNEPWDHKKLARGCGLEAVLTQAGDVQQQKTDLQPQPDDLYRVYSAPPAYKLR